jgi:hypothetical protein
MATTVWAILSATVGTQSVPDPAAVRLGDLDRPHHRREFVPELRQSREQPPFLLQLEAEPVADHQVVVQGLAQAAHDSPSGHGLASGPNATRSTLA